MSRLEIHQTYHSCSISDLAGQSSQLSVKAPMLADFIREFGYESVVALGDLERIASNA